MTIEAKVFSVSEAGVADVYFALPDDITGSELSEAMGAARGLATVLQRINGIEGPIGQQTRSEEQSSPSA